MNSSYGLEFMNCFYARFDQIHTWFSLTLCVFGLLANFITALILTRPNMATVVNKLLTFVALCDSCLLLLYVLYLIYYKFLINVDCPANQMTFTWAVFSLVHANGSIVLRSISLWLSVAIAAYRKRLLYSYHPPSYVEDYSKVTKLIIFTVFLVSAAAVPIFLGNTIVEEIVPDNEVCDNRTKLIYRVIQSNFSFDDRSVLLKINHFINAFLFKLSPCVLLAYYLISIINLLYKRGRLRRGLLSGGAYGYGTTTNVIATVCRSSYSIPYHRKFNPTTVLLGAILTMTILCECPNAVASVLSGLLSDKFFIEVYRNLGDVFDVLSLLNGLTTFIVYCMMSRLFRLTFVGIFFNWQSYKFLFNRTFKNNNYAKEFDEELVDSTNSVTFRTANVSRKGTKDYCCQMEQTKFIINDETKNATDKIRPIYI